MKILYGGMSKLSSSRGREKAFRSLNLKSFYFGPEAKITGDGSFKSEDPLNCSTAPFLGVPEQNLCPPENVGTRPSVPRILTHVATGGCASVRLGVVTADDRGKGEEG